MIRLRLIRRSYVRKHVLLTVLTITDNLMLAHSCQRNVTLRDGGVVEDVRR